MSYARLHATSSVESLQHVKENSAWKCRDAPTF